MNKTYRLIDSHAHLEEIEDLHSAIEGAKQSGVIAIVAVGSDYKSNNKVLEIAGEYSSFVYPALGLHPWNLEVSPLERNLQFIEDNIKNIVAIGEVGLDYQKELIKKSSKDWQKEVLKSILALARRYNKPVIIHARYAWRDSFTLVKEAAVEKAIFHWFTGPLNVLKDISSQGYFVSATLAAEYHEEHRRAIKEVPLENLLLETDSPVEYRGHRAEPADVVLALNSVAELKELPPSIVADKTTENALRLYGISNDPL
ncbi:MAG TPA: TatD family hydrolase [Dehalococcoidia bacterium]|nr:TatD family hydrolase [Dehalococcoidia bacterium]